MVCPEHRTWAESSGPLWCVHCTRKRIALLETTVEAYENLADIEHREVERLRAGIKTYGVEIEEIELGIFAANLPAPRLRALRRLREVLDDKQEEECHHGRLTPAPLKNCPKCASERRRVARQ